MNMDAGAWKDGNELAKALGRIRTMLLAAAGARTFLSATAIERPGLEEISSVLTLFKSGSGQECPRPGRSVRMHPKPRRAGFPARSNVGTIEGCSTALSAGDSPVAAGWKARAPIK